KLKKEKVLAAIALFMEDHVGDMVFDPKGSHGNVRSGRFRQLVQSSKMLKEAVAELDDRQTALKIAQDYVRFIDQLHEKEVRRYVKDAWVRPELEYLYKDAQIWQATLRPKGQKAP